MKYIDPTGALISPYYTEDGTFLGVDEKGFTGEIYITDKATFDKNSNNGVADSKLIQNDKNTSSLKERSISLETQSNIYTDVLKKSTDPKLANMSKLYNGEVSIVENVYYTINGKVYGKGYNDPEGHRSQPKYSTQIIGEEIKVTVQRGANSSDLYTVESIINSLGIHEYYGHGIEKWNNIKTHWKCYNAQLNHPTFNKLPKDQQYEIRKNYTEYYKRAQR